jgi:hypothetical protein
VSENLDTHDVDRRTAVASDAAPAGVVTARRRLMLGAAAVLPSVVTLPAGAIRAAESYTCLNRNLQGDANGVARFTDAPDEWLRKKVFSGRLGTNGKPAYCTTWDQPSVLAIATLESAASGLGYKAIWGTTWSDGQNSVRIGALCTLSLPQLGGGPAAHCKADTVDNINPAPDHYALVYVDETGLSCSLEPEAGMSPVREVCWASLMADRGTSLG